MRTLAAGLVSHLATDTHTRCGMLRLDLVDGSTLAVTDHDRALSFNLGDGSATYSPRTGILPSDLSLSTGFDPDEVEITGPLVDTATEAWHVTRAAVLGGRFDDAVARYFQVNWSSLSSGPIRLLRGYVVKAEVIGSSFKLTIHSEASKYKQEVGRGITGYCDADFQDTRCGYSEAADSLTVVAVTNAREFTVNNANSRADDYFNRGTVSFTSGALNGTRPVEILDWADGGGSAQIALWTDLAEAPQVGDTLDVKRGCGKTREDCMAYNNIVNFRGFPDVPGTDQVLRYPNPAG